MKSVTLARALITLCIILIALGDYLSGHTRAGIIIGLGGILWLVNTVARWYFLSSFSFLWILLGSSLLALWHQEWLALVSVSLALVAWDLDTFSRRLAGIGKVEHEIEKSHVQQVSIIVFIGFLLASIPLAWHFSISLGWTILIAGVLVAALIVTLRSGGQSAS